MDCYHSSANRPSLVIITKSIPTATARPFPWYGRLSRNERTALTPFVHTKTEPRERKASRTRAGRIAAKLKPDSVTAKAALTFFSYTAPALLLTPPGRILFYFTAWPVHCLLGFLKPLTGKKNIAKPIRLFVGIPFRVRVPFHPTQESKFPFHLSYGRLRSNTAAFLIPGMKTRNQATTWTENFVPCL